MCLNNHESQFRGFIRQLAKASGVQKEVCVVLKNLFGPRLICEEPMNDACSVADPKCQRMMPDSIPFRNRIVAVYILGIPYSSPKSFDFWAA